MNFARLGEGSGTAMLDRADISVRAREVDNEVPT